MINNNKIISVDFVSNKSLKKQINNKNFLRTSNVLRKRFSTCTRSASLSEKSSQDFILNLQFKLKKSKNLNIELLNNKDLELNKTTQMVSSVFKKFVSSTSLSESPKKNDNFNGEFFPSKKAFIHYWIFPFVGFAGYIYLNKYNSNLNWIVTQSNNNSETLKFESKQKQFGGFEKVRTAVESTDGLTSLLLSSKTKQNEIEKEFRLLNLQNPKDEFLKCTVLQNEKEESRAAFFVTNFLHNIEKKKNLLHNNSFDLGQVRKQTLIDQVPNKLLPLSKNIKLENNLSKLEIYQDKTTSDSPGQNSNFYQNPIYAYLKATKLIDGINQNILLSQNLTDFNLQQTSQRLNSNKLFVNSELIKQVNQILKISKNNDSYLDAPLSTNYFLPLRPIVKNIKEFEKLNFTAKYKILKTKTSLGIGIVPEFPNLGNSKSERVKNNFHALFLVKYLLKKTDYKHFVNKNAILAYSLKNPILKFKNQQQTKNFMTQFFYQDSGSNDKVKLKLQDFLMTLNKIQTRENLEFINLYKNAFPLLSQNSNDLKTTSYSNTNAAVFAKNNQELDKKNALLVFYKNRLFQLEKDSKQNSLSTQKSNVQYNMSLNNLKWNLYELATLRFLKYFVNPSVKNVYNLNDLKQSSALRNNEFLKYNKLSFILRSFNNKQNVNIVKPLSKEINLNTNQIYYRQNLVPMCFSLSLNEKISNVSFFHLKNSVLLSRNYQNNMSDSMMRVKAAESSLPISKDKKQMPFDSQYSVLSSLKGENLLNSQMSHSFMTKVFTVFQNQTNELFIDRWDYYLKQKRLNVVKSNTPIVFTSELLFTNKNAKILDVKNVSQAKTRYFFKQNKKPFILQYKTTSNFNVKELRFFLPHFSKPNSFFLKKRNRSRLQEKVFRAYLSNKYNKNNIKSNKILNYFRVQKTLKKLKKRFFSNRLTKKSTFFLKAETNFQSEFKENIHILEQLGNSRNLNYPVYQQRYSPNTLLRKLGFLFKYKTEYLNKETWDRVEKHRSIQKKRRRKKQKRFYPRPSWLRFLLYRNFLTTRHSSFDNYSCVIKEQLHSKNKHDSLNKLNKHSLTFRILPSVNSFYFSVSQKLKVRPKEKTQKNISNVSKNFLKNSNYWTNKQFMTKIFRNNKKNQVLQQKYTNSMQLFDQQLRYEKKILNKTSRTLGLNSGKNVMFHSQDYYQISNEVMSDFQKLCWKSYWLRSSLTPYIRRIQKSMQTIRKIEAQSIGLNNSLADSNLLTFYKKQDSSQVKWYLNLKNTMELNSEISTFANFQNLQNRSEYERILYDRISDIIENVKANLDGSGQSRAKAFKVGRTRKDNLNLRRSFSMSPNQLSQRKLNRNSQDSFISRFALFVNNNLNTPTIQAFSLQSLMDQSVKPFGDLPTLRNFWALNQTHALAGFAQAKTNTGQPDKAEWKQLTETKTLWSVLKFREQNASNKTKKFFSLVWKKLMLMPFTYHNLNNLEKLSFQKLDVADKKLTYLGIYLKSNKSILKFWKMNLSFRKSKTNFRSFRVLNSENQFAKLSQQQNIITNLQSQKQAKRSIQFWWSFPEVRTGFHTFPFQKTCNTFNHSLINISHDLKLNKDFLLVLTTLGGCTVLFHLCSLYSFLQSSQIRSLTKFYILVLYKFSNAYLILVYAIFNFIKNYFKQLRFILEVLGEMQKRNKSGFNFLALSQNSTSKVSFGQLSDDLLPTKNETLEKSSSLTRNQIFFYGSFASNIKDSFILDKHFCLLTNFKESKTIDFSALTSRILDKELLLQNQVKNKTIFKFVNLESFKIRFFAQSKGVPKFFVPIPKSQQFSILEMCFYSPNLKLKDLQFQQLQKNNYLSISPTLTSKTQKYQIKDKFFSVDKNFIYSSPKNVSNFISYIITNSQKQQFKNRFYFKKDALVTRKSLVFNCKKSFQQFYSKLWVGLLLMTKSSVSLVYNTIGFGSLILFKIIDILEILIMLIYKFLEKPAEFMIEWIAQLFLVEWSSDITTFVPESFDIYTWRSFTKLSRGSRIFSVFGFLMQRRLWCLFEIYLNLLSKPDTDLLNRQKKGMIFWDVWAEILMIAAEKYSINLSSLTTVKEEQEAFLERLLNDPYWLSSWQSSTHYKQVKITNFNKISKQTRALAELELLATAGNRPDSWLGRQSFFVKEAGIFPSFFKKNKTSNNFLKLFRPTVKTMKNQNNQFTTLNQNFETSRFNYNLNFVNNSSYGRSNQIKVKNALSGSTSSLPSFQFKNESLYFVSDFNLNWKTWQRWSTNQHFTNQGSDTELFIDVHPPKSFAHLSQLKSSQSGISTGIAGLPTLGSLTCMIYSGLFSKQVSKNILIVGSPGNSQTMLIQALAGETELKIIADNAHRYAHIQRGIAVGMKLLRDVFDGLALHTPCLFLMEDIHVIGERRPMLISDNENVKAAEASFAAENEEVHEKNMFIYQLSKHAITDYRKPYKGDFSLLIPTNHFCFDLFLGVSPPKIRKNGKTPRSPFTLETKFYETQKDSTSTEQEKKSTNIILKTLLQKNSEQFFAPPATSPFNILGMKEQRQFKAKQVVKEIPWGGFSNDQMMLLPKATYSIRVKIALLADLAMNQLSVKLDMITDLLVIMDNVRSNRGFVVFATTHVPFVLDPALRRPGRLDETISLPFAPTLIDRFEILKTSLLNYTTTGDFMSYSFLLQNYTETDLSNFISRTKLLLFNNLNDYSQKLNQSYFSLEKENQNFKRKYKLDQTTISSLNTALTFMTQLEVTEPKKLHQRVQKVKQKLYQSQKFHTLKVNSLATIEKDQKSILELLKISKIRSSVSAAPSTIVSITYSQIAKFILGSQLLKDSRVFRSIVPSFEESLEDGEPTIFRNLYSSSIDIQNTLLYLLSGKVGEFFFFNQLKLLKNNNTNSTLSLSKNSFSTFLLKPSLVNPQLNTALWNVSTPLSQTNFTQTQSSTLVNNQKGGSPQVEELWSSATSFLFALVQKRYLYNRTLLMNRLLYFNDISMLKEPPSPPGSAILMNAKKYENFKRTERDFQQKPVYSILDKIMLHQQQRFMKKLYERPVLEVFQSEMVPNRSTSFNSSIKELGYYNSFMRKPSSVQSFYKNRILTRHKYSFINQWWNGQLAEHNLESTFSSDVDWRSMFVETFGDLTIDFPDSDQHYNPKSRRWFLQSTYGGYWNSFEKTISFEVYQHYIIICFNKAINYLHTEREVLDSLAYTYLQKGSFKELDLLISLSRFNTLFKS